jgi:hypothetical protein
MANLVAASSLLFFKRNDSARARQFADQRIGITKNSLEVYRR